MRRKRRPFARSAHAASFVRAVIAVLLVAGGITLFLWARGGAISLDEQKKAQMEQAAYETVIHENTWDALADRFLKGYETR